MQRTQLAALKVLVLGPGLVGLFLASTPIEVMAQSKNPRSVYGKKPGAVYYCPDRTPDQQYSERSFPGCIPLVDKEEEAAKAAKKEAARKRGEEVNERTPVRLENLQREISSFLRDYRKFLDCCINDIDSIETVDELEDRASGLLKDIQDAGLVNMGTSWRGWTMSQIIPPLVRARIDLLKVKQRLEGIGEAKGKLDDLDYETAGKERRRIEQEEGGLTKEFRPTGPPDSARTGLEVGDTTLPNKFGTTFEDTTLRPATGTDIGTVVSPGSDQQLDLRPRPGLDTRDTTLPNYRVGPDTQDTTLPNSFGFDVGGKENIGGSSTTPSRVGPAAGDSSLNKR